MGSGQSVTVTNDVSAPTVSAVTTSASDATYGIGDVIPILIQFNEVVNVRERRRLRSRQAPRTPPQFTQVVLVQIR